MMKKKIVALLCVMICMGNAQVIKAKEAWSKIDGNEVYLVDDKLSKGWIEINNAWYHFNKDTGYLSKGWINEKGCWYYSDIKTGVMHHGWATNGVNWYYLNRSNGIMQTSQWLEEDGQRFYLLEDGRMAVGQHRIDGKAISFGEDGNFIKDLVDKKIEGWLHSGNKTSYYIKGKPIKGWQKLEDKQYYFSTKGTMMKGIVDIEGKTYQFGNDGVFQREITNEGLMIEDNHTVFYKEGTKATGWQKVGKEDYYFDKNGKGISGWFNHANKQSFFVNGLAMDVNRNKKDAERLLNAINQTFDVQLKAVTGTLIPLATQIRANEIITHFSSERGDKNFISVFNEVEVDIRKCDELRFIAEDDEDVLEQLMDVDLSDYTSISLAMASYNQTNFWVLHLIDSSVK